MAKKKTDTGANTTTPKTTTVTTETPKAGDQTNGQKNTVNEALAAIGRKALENHPTLDAAHVTADGCAFGAECDAINHAATLENKEVTTVERETEK